MAEAPLKITLYDPETNEELRTVSCMFIPTGIFTDLARMMKSMDMEHPEQLEPEAVEALYAMICELFGNRITIEEIKAKTELSEFAALLQNIMARVGAVMPTSGGNPTQPGASRSKRRH